MNGKYKYLAKNVGLLTISNFASKILGFLLVPLYTSVLSTTDYGTYDLIVSTITLLYPLITLNIVDAVMRYAMDRETDIRSVVAIGNKYIYSSFLIFTVGLGIITILKIWPSISGFELYIWLYFVFYVLYQYFIQLSKGLEHVSDIAICGLLATISLLGFNLLFLLVFKWGLKGFFAANCLSFGIPDVFFIFRLRAWRFFEIKKLIDQALEKRMLMYCVPLIAVTLGWWINSTADKYTVAIMCGVAANGVLSVSYKIPQILAGLQTIFVQAWQISAIKEYGKHNTPLFYGRTFYLINVLVCAAASWLIILAKPFARILFQKDFFIAWKYVPFLIISCIFNSAAGFLGPILSAKRASKAMAMSAVYGACGNVVMNIAFVYLIGVQGATIATAVSSAIIYFARKRAVGEDIHIDQYYVVICTWGLLCIQAILEIYTSFWGMQLIVMVTMLALNWKEVTHIVKTINIV